MQKKIPKPYIELEGRTLLEWTIRAFLSLRGLRQIILAVSKDQLGLGRQILHAVVPESVTGKVVVGGRERQNSIHRALRSVEEVDLVIVHDAVRPFVKLEHIEACCSAAAEVGAAVLGIPAKDTIKRVDKRQMVVETPERDSLWQAQTPQVFQRSLLVNAYEQAEQKGRMGTDDASLAERMGSDVKMVEGDQQNLKITYPIDVELAKIILRA